MATKKQKHLAALARREAFLKAEKERGLAAQMADQERQAEANEAATERARQADSKLSRRMTGIDIAVALAIFTKNRSFPV